MAAWSWSAPASSIPRSTTGACSRPRTAGRELCANVDAERIERKSGGGCRVLTSKGPIEAREVVIATNGYTGELTPTLKAQLVPVASHIIATEELPEDRSTEPDPEEPRRQRYQAGALLLPALARRQARDLRRPRALHRRCRRK